MEENKSLNKEENEGKKAAVVGRIRALSPAERAALRRNAGRPLSAADGRALMALFRALPPAQEDKHKWFTVLTIACLWDIDEAKETASLPQMLRAYAAARESSGMDSRVRSLLDTRWENDGFFAAKLTRLARMLRADNRLAMPDMDQLLKDLRYWNSDGRAAQIRWADEYFLRFSIQNQNTKEESSNVD